LIFEVVCAYKLEVISYIELNSEKRLIFSYSTSKEKRIVGKGVFVSFTVVEWVFYAEVKEYRRFLIYDPLRPLSDDALEYTDTATDINPNIKKIIPVSWMPDPVIIKIIEKLKKEIS